MERTFKINLKNMTFYLLGFFILGLGVNLMLRADLGAGPWDTVTYNLRAFLDTQAITVTLGTVSIVIASILMITVLLYTKKWVLLGMIVPIFIVGFVIDFWDIIVFQDWTPTNIFIRLLASLTGGVFIPLGLSFVISSHLPAFVFDELTIMLMNVFNVKSITKIRAGIELLGISLGALFGLLAGIGFGAVGIASVIVVLMLPPLLDFFVKKIGAFNEDV